jgi:hypothetical protein
MIKLYRLPLRMGSKTQLSDARRRRKSQNLVVIGILAIGALFALTAIGLTVFGAFKHKATVPQEVGVAQPLAADASPATPESKQSDTVKPLANPNPAPSAPVASSHPASDPRISSQDLTATPARSSTPAVTTAPTGQKHEHKPETEAKSPDKSLTKAARQTLEKKRIEAERKRAKLEEKYQNHEISTDAYNKGKQEYKSEIQKYRDELKSGP